QPAGSELIIVPWTGTTLSAQTFGHYLDCKVNAQPRGMAKGMAKGVGHASKWYVRRPLPFNV
ncbi:hypothetical protein, partial [Bifidobacterium adolescentis]|uniref:hypothetical protein n=1 Tax=Bifidobacterium adolescentis TaxID=1680 RepID=UPI001E3A74F6